LGDLAALVAVTAGWRITAPHVITSANRFATCEMLSCTTALAAAGGTARARASLTCCVRSAAP
jgi:hypothetical protein